MRLHFQKAAQKLLHTPFEKLQTLEKNVIEHIVTRQPISRALERDFDAQATLGQRLADRVATFGGSWSFLMLFGITLLTWIVLNSSVLVRRGLEFDPYPYILLNLALSMLAAMQAPIILMSQNRQAAKDRLAVAHDYEVNLKAEIEIQTLQEKIDRIADIQVVAIMNMLREQQRLLVQCCHPEAVVTDVTNENVYKDTLQTMSRAVPTDMLCKDCGRSTVAHEENQVRDCPVP